MHKFELGQRLRCKVSGFTGIATSRVEYLNGCVQYGLKPPVDKDGKMDDMQFIDVQQLEFVDQGVQVEAAPVGGDTRESPSGDYSG